MKRRKRERLSQLLRQVKKKKGRRPGLGRGGVRAGRRGPGR